MERAIAHARLVRFATFEVDLQAGELRKSGLRLKLSGQPFQVLAILLERPGEVVTREELQKRLWPDSFVDFDHNLNTAINKIREALGDSAENPRFVETLPRRGYRFIGPVDDFRAAGEDLRVSQTAQNKPGFRSAGFRVWIAVAAVIVLAGTGLVAYNVRRAAAPVRQRALTRMTFDEGLQIGATWSPDARFIAYSSNRGGKFDIWVQQLSGGEPVRVTKGPDDNWQPEWSPDGKYVAYRSEAGEGGIFVVPALGGTGFERKIASFGYYPHWSPDGSQLLFQTARFGLASDLYVVGLDGTSPRKVMADLTSEWIVSAAWHPDGRRISAWQWDLAPSPVPRIWTGPVEGGNAIQTQIDPELSKIADTAAGRGISAWGDSDFKFAWAMSGDAIYFERTFHGARNIWRMSVSPRTLRASGLERLTTGAGLDSELALSPDGNRLAFTTKSQRVQAWIFPFDAKHGRITGNGRAVTSAGMEAWNSSMSPDGQHLVSGVSRDGRWELWETSLLDGSESPLFADDPYIRNEARWSPDGARLAYVRYNPVSDFQLVTWSRKNRIEQLIIGPNSSDMAGRKTYHLQNSVFVFAWCPDGGCLLVSKENETGYSDVWLVPVAEDAPRAAARKLIPAQPNYNIWQENFSPDGRWIVFEGVVGTESSVYVVPASGTAPWIRITDGKHWADKPRWSPDSSTIYYISEQKGYFNVWGRRFDPKSGRPQGEPFAVTSFDSPKMMVGQSIPNIGLSVAEDRLVLTVTQESGSIWVLDNVDR